MIIIFHVETAPQAFCMKRCLSCCVVVPHRVRLAAALFTQGDCADCWFVTLTSSSSSSSAPGPPSSTPSSLRGQKRRSSSRREKVRPPAPLFCNGDASPPRCSLELFFSAVLTVCVCVCVCLQKTNLAVWSSARRHC